MDIVIYNADNFVVHTIKFDVSFNDPCPDNQLTIEDAPFTFDLFLSTAQGTNDWAGLMSAV